MAFTQADLDALDRAIADSRGAKSISFNGENIQLNDIDQLNSLRSTMKRDIDQTAGRGSANRYAVVRKGT